MSGDGRRGRGRPKGSGKPDEPVLRDMAARLIDDPMLKPTTVIKRLIGTKNDSDIRRLQVKWKADGQKLIVEARERRQVAEPRMPIEALIAKLAAATAPTMPLIAQLAAARAAMLPSVADLPRLNAMAPWLDRLPKFEALLAHCPKFDAPWAQLAKLETPWAQLPRLDRLWVQLSKLDTPLAQLAKLTERTAFSGN
jgi:hypothetical protein